MSEDRGMNSESCPVSNMTQIVYRSEIFAEGNCYVGLCRELDVSSFGDTPMEAKESLREAVEAFIEGCEYLGTLTEVLEESGFRLTGGVWKSRGPVIVDEVTVLN